jgi:very-short-patch-repair endonuclease
MIQPVVKPQATNTQGLREMKTVQDEDTTQHKNAIDLQKYERTTPTQEKLLDALLRLLHHKAFRGVVYYNCLVPSLDQRGKVILRRPDIFIPTIGLIIEDDGSAHDDCDNRVHRDLTRETYATSLRSVCIRFPSQDIADSEKLQRIMGDLSRLIDERRNDPNWNRDCNWRRFRLHKSRQWFQRSNPDFDLGRAYFDEHSKMDEPHLYAYRAWSGRVYVFDHSTYRGQEAPGMTRQRLRKAAAKKLRI